jgi:hypothetical protein
MIELPQIQEEAKDELESMLESKGKNEDTGLFLTVEHAKQEAKRRKLNDGSLPHSEQ